MGFVVQTTLTGNGDKTVTKKTYCTATGFYVDAGSLFITEADEKSQYGAYKHIAAYPAGAWDFIERA